MLRILNSILDYAKLSHGSTPVDLSAVDIAEVCRTTIELHTATAATKGLELRCRLDLPSDGASAILTDEVKLFEILNNLLSNALKFTRTGFVELQVQLEMVDTKQLPAASLNLRVSDSGPGIELDDQHKIFLPFFRSQVDPGRAAAGGTGLGLAIVRDLVTTLGGEIRVESALGVGTVFTVSLPTEMAASHALQRTAPSIDSGAAGRFSASDDTTTLAPTYAGRRLLLVDDNELNSWLASRLLQAIGFDVVLAENGAVAVDRLANEHFDIVLMDCQMPVLDGYEATRQVRGLESRRGTRRTPIIAITANTLAGDRDVCLRAGMDDYLGKPYGLRDLRPVLARWLDDATRHEPAALSRSPSAPSPATARSSPPDS